MSEYERSLIDTNCRGNRGIQSGWINVDIENVIEA